MPSPPATRAPAIAPPVRPSSSASTLTSGQVQPGSREVGGAGSGYADAQRVRVRRRAERGRGPAEVLGRRGLRPGRGRCARQRRGQLGRRLGARLGRLVPTGAPGARPAGWPTVGRLPRPAGRHCRRRPTGWSGVACVGRRAAGRLVVVLAHATILTYPRRQRCSTSAVAPVPALSRTVVACPIWAGARLAGASPSPAGGAVTAITASTASPTEPAPASAVAVAAPGRAALDLVDGRPRRRRRTGNPSASGARRQRRRACRDRRGAA